MYDVLTAKYQLLYSALSLSLAILTVRRKSRTHIPAESRTHFCLDTQFCFVAYAVVERLEKVLFAAFPMSEIFPCRNIFVLLFLEPKANAKIRAERNGVSVH